MTVYICDPKISTWEPLLLINTLSNIAEYESNSQKQQPSYIKMPNGLKGNQGTPPFTIASHNIKYFETTLNRQNKMFV